MTTDRDGMLHWYVRVKKFRPICITARQEKAAVNDLFTAAFFLPLAQQTPIISFGNNLILPCLEGISIFNRVNGSLLWQSSNYPLGVTVGN